MTQATDLLVQDVNWNISLREWWNRCKSNSNRCVSEQARVYVIMCHVHQHEHKTKTVLDSSIYFITLIFFFFFTSNPFLFTCFALVQQTNVELFLTLNHKMEIWLPSTCLGNPLIAIVPEPRAKQWTWLGKRYFRRGTNVTLLNVFASQLKQMPSWCAVKPLEWKPNGMGLTPQCY